MTLPWFGIIIFGLAGLLWLIDWLFDRGEVDSQPYIDGVPVDTIHVDLWPGNEREDLILRGAREWEATRTAQRNYNNLLSNVAEQVAFGDSNERDDLILSAARTWEAQQNDPEAINRQANLMQQARCSECEESLSGQHAANCSYLAKLAACMQNAHLLPEESNEERDRR